MSESRNSSRRVQELLTGGLIPAVPVPLDVHGKLHVRGHDSYLRFMSSQVIAGVAVWAHTGRGLLLDTETANRVLSDWRSALPNSVVIAGVGNRGVEATNEGIAHGHAAGGDACGPGLTIKMAEAALDHGADALLVYAPTWLRDDSRRDELIVDHHERLSSLGIPLILFYLYEAAGGISYSPTVLDELLSLPNVVGIKIATLNSVMTFQDVARHLQTRHPDKLLITGEDRFFGYSLRLGAKAALVGMGAVCCELQSDLIKAHLDRNAERFLELSDLVDTLAETLFIDPMEGYIKRILLALAHLGIIAFEAAHDPWGPEITTAESESIAKVINTLSAYAN